ncbi:head completion/stabilization protein [Enterobacter hormaechei]|uniref:head completion/stabilization protein n=1 Tax=Enterobacter hormaechei TaxID=158836 RepID=UPI0007355744|nr:head completion/stabilization protein [Enterobacter hormaechei]KTI09152.1 head completion/stabilization protein [Enterobacter hormaechei subsp. xiangfangensis]
MTTLVINNPPQKRDPLVIPPVPDDEQVIKNTPFFPDVDPKRVREEMRLEQTVSPVRLRRAIKAAIAETNAELSEWREYQQDTGYARLEDVPTDKLDGESVRVFHYLNAVCAMTAATLYERYRGVDASAKGDKKADSIDSTIDEMWRDMRWSVARIQDKARCIVGQI